MLKKIALLVVLFALPLGAMAQKFAHMNSQEVIVVTKRIPTSTAPPVRACPRRHVNGYG